MRNNNETQNIVEALLFVSDQPLTLKRMGEIVAATRKELEEAVSGLSKQLKESGTALKVVKVAGGVQLVTREKYSPYLKKFFTTRKRTTLTRASLETLAIIAYKQPITRTEIELIRGVNVDGVVSTLMERQLIEIKGRKEVPGNPLLYGTTQEFLIKFGLNSLKELPTKEELEAMFAAKEESDPETDAASEISVDAGNSIPAEERDIDEAGEDQGKRESNTDPGNEDTPDGQDRIIGETPPGTD